MINPNDYTAHKSPGKFEGESAATEYFYEQMMNGDGETIFASCEESDEDTDSECAELFQISVEESEAFGLALGSWFLLREDSQGFVMGSVHDTREAAEQKFRDWLGV